MQRGALRAPFDLNHTSHFDYLPTEIVSAIFAFYTSELRLQGSPFTIGAVSRKWRHIAWSTPELWSNLKVFFYGTRERKATQARLAKDWLSRSGDLPLSISINAHRIHEDELFLISELLLDLNRYCDRWYILDLTMPSDMLPFLSASSCASPNLYKLCLSLTMVDSSFPTLQLSTLAPCIVEVNTKLNHLGLNWDFVTDVTMSSLSVRRILRLLQTAPYLERCKFSYVDNEDGDLPDSTYTHIRHLLVGTLTIDFASQPEAAELLFEHLSLPALENFELQAPRFDFDIDLVPFFIRSSCKLQTLSLQHLFYAAERLVRIASVLPTLKELRITEVFMNFLPFFRALDWPPSSEGTLLQAPMEPLLPSLRLFKFDNPVGLQWEGLPYFFAQFPSADGLTRRPLESIIVRYRNWPSTRIPYLSRQVLSLIVNFMESVQFDISIDFDTMGAVGNLGDLIRLSTDRLEQSLSVR